MVYATKVIGEHSPSALRLRVRLTKQINKLGLIMFPQSFQGCIKPPLGPDQDHRERRVGFTCNDLITSCSASWRICEARGKSAEVNGLLAGPWLLSYRALHKNVELHFHMSPRLSVVSRYCTTLRLSQITGCVAGARY